MYGAEIDNQIRERIFDSTVNEVYEVWKSRGLLIQVDRFLGRLPEKVAAPIAFSFATHVHKEKGLFLDLIGEQFGVDKQSRQALAVSADLLWALSLMLDDIEDNDTTRGGRQSCWMKYGKELTLLAVSEGVKAVAKHISSETAQALIGRSCIKYAQLGVESLHLHKHMGLDTPTAIVARNYEQRCDFHGTFQLMSMSEILLSGQKRREFQTAAAGLRLLNQAGQLGNDLKDIAGGDVYGRSFSDIRNGVPTIPIIDMYDELNSHDKHAFKLMFGAGQITPSNRAQLSDFVQQTQIVVKTNRRIFDSHTEALNTLNSLFDDPEMSYFSKWVQYKQLSIHKSLDKSI